jgi:oligopeptidase A
MAFKLALCLVVLMSFLARISARRTTAMSLFVSGGTGGFFLGSTKTNSAPAADSLRMSSSVATTNPLVVKGPLPKFDEIAPIHVLEAVTSDLDKLKEEFTRLEAELAGKKPDYALVVEQMEKIQAPLGFSWGVTGHLMGVKNGDDLRKAHDEIQPDVVKTSQQLGQSKVVYQALKVRSGCPGRQPLTPPSRNLCHISSVAHHHDEQALREDTAAWDKLEEAQQRIVASALRGMVHSGVGLEDTQREHFNKLQLELAELSTKFSNNVLDSTKAFKLRLTDAKDVEGLPTSALELAAQRAKTEGDAEATAAAGPWVVTLDMPSYLPAMQHLKNRDIREKLYRAYATRASSGDNDNAPVITRILTIKRELAQMLGYKSIAEKSLASKMAPSVDAVMQLTDMLQVAPATPHTHRVPCP